MTVICLIIVVIALTVALCYTQYKVMKMDELLKHFGLFATEFGKRLCVHEYLINEMWYFLNGQTLDEEYYEEVWKQLDPTRDRYEESEL